MALIDGERPNMKSFAIKTIPHLAVVGVALSSSLAWGQQLTASRWSTDNPPTPSLVDPQIKPSDAELRRLPPIDDQPPVPTQTNTVSSAGVAPQVGPVAAKPQNASLPTHAADPVDWSRPSVVIGPEVSGRTVSHEEALTASQPQPGTNSRFASMPSLPKMPAPPAGGSRFTHSAPPALPPVAAPEKKAEKKPSQPIFARVFDEEVEQKELSQPEVATSNDDGLSPIFACRLLGLPAIKAENNGDL
ncbi:hypothetical protein [Bremerella cremea]|uniref:hypothetical protein n=1 Tax=Bremerella cremea TaxID=1031537 RepID=UPI0031F0C049